MAWLVLLSLIANPLTAGFFKSLYTLPMTQIIEPLILKGTRDFLPEQMLQRQAVLQTIQGLFEQSGYVPIETPILSPAETILGKYGAEGDRLTYNFTDRGGRAIALPYDLTVPFARYFAAHWRELPLPFKRYQIQRVWRAEKPQKGRLREFYQCDIDIIGSDSLVGEAEILRLIDSVFTTLGLDVTIKINSRRLMNAVLRKFGVTSDVSAAVIRSIDKLDKIGREAVCTELTSLGVQRADELLQKLTPAENNTATVQQLQEFDCSEITTVQKYAEALGVNLSRLEFNPSLARGLDYYTGLIFEVIARDQDLGSVCGGGRYDNLCGLFSKEAFSGVGVAFGFERIMLALEQLGKLPQAGTLSQVLVTVFDDTSVPVALRIYRTLLDASIASEVYLQPAPLGKQFKFADQKKIPFVVVCGPDEQAQTMVSVRVMSSGKQKIIPQQQLVQYIQGYV